MKFIKTKIPDLILVENSKFIDKRGLFIETYHEKNFFNGNIKEKFIQDNFVYSKKHVLRGLHYQYKYPQGKLISCIRGEILDVALDIRSSSTTFGKWFSVILSSNNLKQLYIPPGFAHGYLVLSSCAEVYYKCTDIYHPEDQYGINWEDPDINVDWNIEKPILSHKDRHNPMLKDQNKLFI